MHVTNLSSEYNLLAFQLNAPVVIRAKVKNFRRNLAKLLSKLMFITDNLLFIYYLGLFVYSSIVSQVRLYMYITVYVLLLL